LSILAYECVESQNFQGGAGDDVILAGGGSLADIMALFNI
jgi:hypothetical protein